MRATIFMLPPLWARRGREACKSLYISRFFCILTRPFNSIGA